MNIPKPTQQLKIALLIFATLGAVQSQAMVCRVTTDGTNTGDGSDWNGQAMDLHTALGDIDCSEIWVKAGVYKPHASDRSVSFTIARQVQVYGGFAGTESEREARDPVAHPGILSGDIDDNDTVNAIGVTETADDIVGGNSYHVVWIDGTSTPITDATLIDGFIITAGLTKLDFGGDFDPDLFGGGVHCKGDATGSRCSPMILNTSIIGNKAFFGGGMSIDGSGDGESSPTLINVTFAGNNATGGGGVMINGGVSGTANAVFNNVTFSANSADQLGGALAIDGVGGTAHVMLINTTFNGNSSTGQGGAIVNFGDGTSLDLRNSILFGNTATANPEVWNDFDASAQIDDSIVEGGCPANSTCNNLITDDPLLGPLANNGGFTPSMLPGIDGAAIDNGNNVTCLSEDQRGVPRPQGNACDIGAVELIYVQLTVEVSGQGIVNAWVSPEPASGGIADCDEAGAGQSHCAATYVEDARDEVSLNISPEQHWYLDTVDGCDGELDGTNFNIASLTASCTVSVTFAINQYTLEYSAGPGGSIAGSPNQTVNQGADGTLVAAVANDNYEFVQWSDGQLDALRTDTNITENLSVTAEFAPSVDEVFDDRFEQSGQ